MKGFKDKSGKFRPTENRKKSSLKKSDLKGATVFGGVGLFDMPNNVGDWEGQTGFRGMMDVWKNKKTGDRIFVEPYEDTPPERQKALGEFEKEWEVIYEDGKHGDVEGTFIGTYEEALQVAHDEMTGKKGSQESWKSRNKTTIDTGVDEDDESEDEDVCQTCGAYIDEGCGCGEPVDTQFKKGDIVMLDNVNGNYNDFEGKKLRITHVATSTDEHQGYDEGVGGGLYDLETLDGEEVPYSLYDYELESA